MQDDLWWGRYTYDQFRILQPRIEAEGIWQHNNACYILCPLINDSTTLTDGTLLSDWFNRKCRPMAANVKLTNSVPVDATRLVERSLAQNIELSGVPLTMADFYSAIALELKKDFPDFSIVEDFIKKDEEFWLDNRISLLSNMQTSLSNSQAFDNLKNCCFIDSNFGRPVNLRSYFPLYRTIFLILPYNKNHNEIINHLKITESELINLINLGYVKVVLPWSINKFNFNFLERIANECSENSLLLSRKLAALTITRSRQRLPLLYPPLPPKDRQELLKMMQMVGENVTDKNIKEFIFSIVQALSDIWKNEYLGYGRLCGEIFRILHSVDRRLELMSVSFLVEFSGALNATLIPGIDANEIQLSYMEKLASLYYGVSGKITRNFVPKLQIITEDILTINNDAPIIELADSLNKNVDINRLRNFIIDFSKNDMNDFPQVISEFNESIKRYNIKYPIFKKTVDGVIAAYSLKGTFPHLASY